MVSNKQTQMAEVIVSSCTHSEKCCLFPIYARPVYSTSGSKYTLFRNPTFTGPQAKDLVCILSIGGCCLPREQWRLCRPSPWQSSSLGRFWKKVEGPVTGTLLGLHTNTWTHVKSRKTNPNQMPESLLKLRRSSSVLASSQAHHLITLNRWAKPAQETHCDCFYRYVTLLVITRGLGGSLNIGQP